MHGNKLEVVYICLFWLAAYKDSQRTNFPAQHEFLLLSIIKSTSSLVIWPNVIVNIYMLKKLHWEWLKIECPWPVTPT